MKTQLKMLLITAIGLLSNHSVFAQAPNHFSASIQRQFDLVKNDVISTAEAMPEDKFFFTPENLKIPNSAFEGVRTFAGQIMHLATDNILIWSTVTGDPVRPDITDVNGPKTVNTKAAIIQYLKDSFDIGQKAINTITEQNAMDMIEFRGSKLSRLDLVFFAITHSNNHYGQMVVYLRMCGLVPPASVPK